MSTSDVIVIGAGAAGLRAADLLAAAGRRVLILEARDRIGGRIHTLTDKHAPVPIELGAEFVHGRPAATMELLEEARATLYTIPEKRAKAASGRLVDFEVADSLEPVMKRLASLGRTDMSFAEFLRRRCRGERLAKSRQFAAQFVEGFDAADTRDISARSIAEEQEGVADLETEPQFRPLAGYASLMDFLWRRSHKAGARLRLAQHVTRIDWSREDVAVHVHGRTRAVTARHAIVTLPLGVLQQSPARGGVRFEPEIASIRAAAAQLGAGAIVKAVLVFREPLWESARADGQVGFIHDPGAAFPTLWTHHPLRAPVLTAWAGGRAALALSGGSRAKLIQTAVASIAHTLGKRAHWVRARLRSAHCHDWPADPHCRGAYSYVRVDGARPRSARHASRRHTLLRRRSLRHPRPGQHRGRRTRQRCPCRTADSAPEGLNHRHQRKRRGGDSAAWYPSSTRLMQLMAPKSERQHFRGWRNPAAR